MASVPWGIIRVRDTSPTILAPGRWPSNAGLGALAHFDLNGGAGAEIVLVYAEPPRGHLHNGVGAILVKVLMQSPLAGIVVNAQLLRGPGPGWRGRCS